jgi:hypothetical protein
VLQLENGDVLGDNAKVSSAKNEKTNTTFKSLNYKILTLRYASQALILHVSNTKLATIKVVMEKAV